MAEAPPTPAPGGNGLHDTPASVDEDRDVRLLVVDTDVGRLRSLERTLQRGGYASTGAADARQARALVASEDFALMLVDVSMPGKSGFDLLTGALKEHPDLAIVMIAGADDVGLVEAGLSIGVYGYIIKPFKTNEILLAISSALRRRALEMENRHCRHGLEAVVKERTTALWNAVRDLERARDDLRLSQAETLERLAVAAEYRGDETSRHIERVSRYSRMLMLLATGDSERAETTGVASTVHDVGKIGIPDEILLKPGKLTPVQYEAMKEHARFGHRILAGGRSDLLRVAATIAITHHEKWDGTGYPEGLTGDEIPLEGRVAAIADVFDAVTSDRVDRKAYELPQALERMREGRGIDFDPTLLDLFFDNIDGILRIREGSR